jgi:hypothetical protein
MGQEAVRTIFAVITAFVGLAILSVILSKKGNAPALLQNISSGVAQDINAATSPVTGNSNMQVSFASS